MYVFDTRMNPDGTFQRDADGKKKLIPSGRNAVSFPSPETLANAGFTATQTHRKVTFKISLDTRSSGLRAGDVKKIQGVLSKMLPVRIPSYRRVWNEAFKASEKSNAKRDELMAMVSAKIQPAIAAYAAFNQAAAPVDSEMETIPTVEPVQVPVGEVVEVNAGPSTVPPEVSTAIINNLEEDGEDAFVASQGQGDELANLFGGLGFGGEEGAPSFGGKKRTSRRKTRKSRKGKKRATRRR